FRFDRHSSEDGIERTEFLVPLEDHEAGAEMFVPNGYQRSQEVGVGERQLDRIAPGPPSGPYVGKLLDHLGCGRCLDPLIACGIDQPSTRLGQGMPGSFRTHEDRGVEEDHRPPLRSSSSSALRSPGSGTGMSGAWRIRAAASRRRRVVGGRARSIASRTIWATDVPRASASWARRSYRSRSSRIWSRRSNMLILEHVHAKKKSVSSRWNSLVSPHG